MEISSTLDSRLLIAGVIERCGLFGHVVSGRYIVFDDYGWKPFKKQRDAENRFMADRGHFILDVAGVGDQAVAQ